MKPSFRETADRQLSSLRFTDNMKLNVLREAKRRQRPVYTKYLAAACAVVVIAFAFLIKRSSPAPDAVIVTGIPDGQAIASEYADISVDSCEWNGYILTVDYTVRNVAENNVTVTSMPLASGGVTTAGNTVTSKLSPEESVSHTAEFRIADCKPGQEISMNISAEVTCGIDNITALMNVPVNVTVPKNMHMGSAIASGAHAENGLFKATVSECLFTPAKSSFVVEIEPSVALAQKDNFSFSVVFTAADGITATYCLDGYLLSDTASTSRNRTYSFDNLIDFAPASIEIICEWTDGTITNTAAVTFAHPAY